jgi:hypothetical protein
MASEFLVKKLAIRKRFEHRSNRSTVLQSWNSDRPMFSLLTKPKPNRPHHASANDSRMITPRRFGNNTLSWGT